MKAKQDRATHEMIECTFKPTINRKRSRASRSRDRSADAQPKGFEQTIERMRKKIHENELKKQME